MEEAVLTKVKVIPSYVVMRRDILGLTNMQAPSPNCAGTTWSYPEPHAADLRWEHPSRRAPYNPACLLKSVRAISRDVALTDVFSPH